MLIADGSFVHKSSARADHPRGTRRQARLVQISDLGEVRWAGLETNGRISFLTRAE